MSRLDGYCLLEISSGGQSKKEKIDKSSFIIGRGESADVKIGASGVSRAHLSVEIQNDKIQIKDLGSANGTRLNGRKLVPHQANDYAEGDAINLGLAQDILTLKLVKSSAAHAEPALPPIEESVSSDIELPPLPVVEMPPLPQAAADPSKAPKAMFQFTPPQKVEPLKVDLPKFEPHPEPPKVEPPKVEFAKFEMPKMDLPKVEAGPVVKPRTPPQKVDASKLEIQSFDFQDPVPVPPKSVEKPAFEKPPFEKPAEKSLTEGTVVDPEFKRISHAQHQAMQEQVLEEARGQALKLKIGAETEAAKIAHDAKSRALEEINKAKQKSEEILAKALDDSYGIQKQAEGEAAKLREAMKEAMGKLHVNLEGQAETLRQEAKQKGEAILADYQSRAEKLLSDARVSATVIKGEAQREADALAQEAYQKNIEDKKRLEEELKVLEATEKEKISGIVGGAENEADKILIEARSASDSIRKRAEKETSEVKMAARTEAQKIEADAKRHAQLILEKTKEKEMAVLMGLEETKKKAEAEAKGIEEEARKYSENIIVRAREEGEKIKDDVIKQALEDGEKIKEDVLLQARREANNFLKVAESDRIGLTKSLEKLNGDVMEMERKKLEISNSTKTVQKKNSDLKGDLEKLTMKYNDADIETQKKLAELSSQVTAMEKTLANRTLEVESKTKENQKILDTVKAAEASVKNAQAEKGALVKSIDDLKKQEAQLSKSLQSQSQSLDAERNRQKALIEKEMATFKEEMSQEVKRLREKAMADFEKKKSDQSGELEHMRKTELDTIKGLRKEEEVRFHKARKHQVLDISKALETYLVSRIKEALNYKELPKNMSNLFPELKDIVERVIEGEFTGTVHDTELGVREEVTKKSDRKRNIALVGGVGLAALSVIFFVPNMNDGKGGRKPASQIFLERLKLKEAQKPKFTPKITQEYKDSYTDNVIYTKDYTDFKLDQDNQAKWIKDLNKFFMNDLNLNENAIVDFISQESSLVNQLKDMRALIHLENQNEQIQKMADLEKQTEGEMVRILGGDPKYKSFRDFEKNYFYQNRKPASINPTTTTTP